MEEATQIRVIHAGPVQEVCIRCGRTDSILMDGKWCLIPCFIEALDEHYAALHQQQNAAQEQAFND